MLCLAALFSIAGSYGSAVSRPSYSKSDGVRAFGSWTSDDMYVSGRLLRIASISESIVRNSLNLGLVRPSIFLMASFVRPTRRFQKPPYHGTRFGIKRHSMWQSVRYLVISGHSYSFLKTRASLSNVVALSDNTILGWKR